MSFTGANDIAPPSFFDQLQANPVQAISNFISNQPGFGGGGLPPEVISQLPPQAGGSPNAQQAANLNAAYQEAGVTPPASLAQAINQNLAPPAFASFPGVPPGAIEQGVPRRREVITGGFDPFPAQINFQGEQALLTPVAVLSAFFNGNSGEEWGYGAFYDGVNPEDRNPPAFMSGLTHEILSQTIDPDLIGQLYDFDPVT